MQKSPTVTARAQKVWLDNDGDLVVFDHFGIVHRTRKGFQNSFRTALFKLAHYPLMKELDPATDLVLFEPEA